MEPTLHIKIKLGKAKSIKYAGICHPTPGQPLHSGQTVWGCDSDFHHLTTLSYWIKPQALTASTWLVLTKPPTSPLEVYFHFANKSLTPEFLLFVVLLLHLGGQCPHLRCVPKNRGTAGILQTLITKPFPISAFKVFYYWSKHPKTPPPFFNSTGA
jgi:hypothetical protein